MFKTFMSLIIYKGIMCVKNYETTDEENQFGEADQIELAKKIDLTLYQRKCKS